jgi:hypothetical protein
MQSVIFKNSLTAKDISVIREKIKPAAELLCNINSAGDQEYEIRLVRKGAAMTSEIAFQFGMIVGSIIIGNSTGSL